MPAVITVMISSKNSDSSSDSNSRQLLCQDSVFDGCDKDCYHYYYHACDDAGKSRGISVALQAEVTRAHGSFRAA